MSVPSKPILIIYGAGPNLSLSVAQAFLPTHTVILISRTLAHLEPLVKQLEDEGGEARGYEADASEQGLKSVFEKITREWEGRRVEVGLWNASSPGVNKPFLETTNDEFEASVQLGITGPATFARLLLPLILSNPTTSTTVSKGSLFFTGATAALRGSAHWGTFAVEKFGMRALTQSLAKEFGKEGVHVAHLIVDGGVKSGDPTKIDPAAIARTYLMLHQQDRTGYTAEIELRSAVEEY